MSKESWKSDKWFTSPWNFEKEVIKDFSFADRIEIHDITLRDGEQQAGVVFTDKDKIEIAEKLIDAGVHRIEAGMPAVSKYDEAAIRKIVKMAEGTETKVFSFSRCMKDDVERSVQTGVYGIIIEIPASEHIIKYAYRWPLQKAIDLSIEATLYAKENGLYTVYFPIDASRASITWFLDLVEKISTEGHMDALAMVDTFGVIAPTTVRYLIRKIKSRIKKPIEAHFHNDFGLGTANTLIALTEGVKAAHVTVSSLGERAGNASLEEVVVSLLTMYGVDVGIKTDKLKPLSDFVLGKIPGYKIATNRPIIGERIYNVESGIIADWIVKCGKEHILESFPFRWDLVGHREPEIVIGKGSGKPSIIEKLHQMGITDIDDSKVGDILFEVKEQSFRKKGLLTDEEFRQIVDRVLAGN